MTFHSIIVPVFLQNLLNASFPILISLFAALMQTTDQILSTFKSSTETQVFDFIVVGGGSAGSAVAARLSEDPSTKVLLIEAGGDPNPITLIPAVTPSLNQPSIDYLYATQPSNSSAFAIENGSIIWPRGRSLGGSSNQNFMYYQRGNPNDYDNWANLTEDIRWSYSNLERIFRNIEDYHGNWPGRGHSQGGPVRIEPLSFAPGSKYILAAAEELGIPIKDPNNLQTQSFAPVDVTQMRGFRFSTYAAYIKPNKHRTNLFIRRYSQATKIHFDKNLKAVAVTYFHHNNKRIAYARKEIVLCAGAIASPQLLMLSGIGPKEHLLQNGIRPLVDSPGIGANLQDHVSTITGPFLVSKKVSFIPERDLSVGDILDYALKGTGPFTSPLSTIVIGLVATRGVSPTWPNIMYTILGIGMSPTLLLALNSFLRIKQSAIDAYMKPFTGQDAFPAVTTLGSPKSRGVVRLRDSNPFSRPIIEPRYYSDEEGEDIQRMVDGMEILVKLFEGTKSLGGQLGARLIPLPVPGCEKYEDIRSKPYLECVARTLTLTLYHPVGTCAMGKRGHLNAVVDSELRVIGVKGLRVADASIMPQIPNANTNAPSIMIGEMCGEMIRAAWR